MMIDWNELADDCVDFAQRLIQTPSMTHEEGEIAQLIASELRMLDFDEVWLDEIGNVYGRIYGADRSLGALVLNTHTDHVDPGDLALWDVSPYAGTVQDGQLIGRGAVDIKGPLAVQVYSMAALKQAGIVPKRDVVFTGVVEEEIGGTGSRYWAAHLDYPVELVVVGEPSSNRLSLGHRGIYGIIIRFHGRSVHASMPAKGENPNYDAGTFLHRLRERQHELKEHPILGRTTVSPTLLSVDTTSKNVTPAWTRLFLDFRTATDSPKTLADFVHDVAQGLNYTIHSAYTEDVQPALDNTEVLYGFYTAPDSEIVQRVMPLLKEGMGGVELGSYNFATDGRIFPNYGIPVLGFAPGSEFVAHTANESIAIAEMKRSLKGHVALLQNF